MCPCTRLPYVRNVALAHFAFIEQNGCVAQKGKFDENQIGWAGAKFWSQKRKVEREKQKKKEQTKLN